MIGPRFSHTGLFEFRSDHSLKFTAHYSPAPPTTSVALSIEPVIPTEVIQKKETHLSQAQKVLSLNRWAVKVFGEYYCTHPVFRGLRSNQKFLDLLCVSCSRKVNLRLTKNKLGAYFLSDGGTWHRRHKPTGRADLDRFIVGF